MSNTMVVRRLVASDADLASQTIRTLKWEAESPDVSSSDSAGLRLWLGNPANVLIAAHTEDGIGVGFSLGYLLDRIDRP